MFEWKPEYSVQIPGIDAQHRQLFASAAELHAAMSQGKGKAILEKALARLVDYTKQHFTAEEELMRKHRYPELAAHIVEHKAFTTGVVDFQKKFQQQEASITVELMIFLKEWLAHHIAGSDQKYAAQIRGR